MKLRFFVAPCDDDDGRTWDVRERMPDGSTRTVTQKIPKRIQAREEAKKLNAEPRPKQEHVLPMAKAGEEMSAKAMSRLRQTFPRIFARFDTKESITVQPKSETKNGQWMCADCGEAFQNNMQAHMHTPSHRRVWWTGEHFEEA